MTTPQTQKKTKIKALFLEGVSARRVGDIMNMTPKTLKKFINDNQLNIVYDKDNNNWVVDGVECPQLETFRHDMKKFFRKGNKYLRLYY